MYVSVLVPDIAPKICMIHLNIFQVLWQADTESILSNKQT